MGSAPGVPLGMLAAYPNASLVRLNRTLQRFSLQMEASVSSSFFFDHRGYIYIFINTIYMHVALVHLEKTLILYDRVLYYILHSRQIQRLNFTAVCVKHS